MFYIYMHTSPSGKKYIGQTCQKVNRRWRNGIGYKKNPYFWRAIEKYGWDNFKHEILFQCETLEDANRVEEWLISVHKSNVPEFGYNISAGADGRGIMSERTKELLRQTHKGKFKGKENPNYGRKHTEEERKRMSEANKEYFLRMGHGACYGRKASPESRKRMSEARKKSEAVHEHMIRMNKAKAKKVLCVETGTIYESARGAARELGLGQGNISTACRNGIRAYGFHWRYVA